MRYVFDTNVIISTVLFPKSIPAKAFNQGLQNGQILFSLELLEEVNEVLNRPKFQRYISNEDINEFLIALVERTTFVKVMDIVHEYRDPKDDKLLELAISGKAQVIVTGDRDLLTMNPFRNISIITPEQFLI